MRWGVGVPPCAEPCSILRGPQTVYKLSTTITVHLAFAGSAEKEATQIKEGLNRLLLRTGAAAPDDKKQWRDERHQLEQQRGLHLGRLLGAQQGRQDHSTFQEQEEVATADDLDVVDILRQLRRRDEEEGGAARIIILLPDEGEALNLTSLR